MRINFQRVGFSSTKKGCCSKCGKKCQQTKRFEQTINPWNNKTSEQIQKENKKESDKWMKIPILCNDCR